MVPVNLPVPPLSHYLYTTRSSATQVTPFLVTVVRITSFSRYLRLCTVYICSYSAHPVCLIGFCNILQLISVHGW